MARTNSYRGNIPLGLASVAGYCRTRSYDGCATQAERDAGEELGLNRPATADETFNHFVIGPLLKGRSLDGKASRAK